MRGITFTLSILLSSACFAGTKILPYITDVNVDGINKEWPSHLPQYDPKTGINFEVANDISNMYFILKISDAATQKQIMQDGLEIWINAEGKKKKTTGITFPLPLKEAISKGGRPEKGQSGEGVSNNSGNSSYQMPNTAPGEMKPGMQTGEKGPMPNNNFKLAGFLIDNGIQPIKGCRVKAAAITNDAGCTILEFSVPFNTFYKEKLDMDDINTKFCIGFVIKGDSQDSNNDGDMGGGPGMGGPGPGMRGPGGGMGMGGPGMGGPGGDMGMGGSSNSKDYNQAKNNQAQSYSEKAYWFKATPSVQ